MMSTPLETCSAVANRHDVAANVTIASRISAARERLGYTQGELSRRMNSVGANATRPETISRYESGKYIPSADALVWLADALAVSVDYLLGRTNDPRPVAAESGPAPTVSPYGAFEMFLETEHGRGASEAERAMLAAIRLPDDEVPEVHFYLQVLLAYRLSHRSPPSRIARRA